MLVIAFIIFIVLLFFGISLNKITIKGIFKGFIPFLISVLLCGGVSFGLWKILLIIHPQYNDILHGFTYNGYEYIAAFVFLNLWISFKIYKYFLKQDKTTDLLIAPIFIWLIINLIIAINLKGAGFFIIPVFSSLLILAIAVFLELEEKSKRILFTILSIPTIYIFAPMIKMFPVGLGLKNLFISGVIIALIFGLMTLTFYQKKSFWMQKIACLLTIIFFGLATFNSGFSIDNKKPNSIVYIQNSDDKTAYFGTYDSNLDAYTSQVFDENSTKMATSDAETKSKYNTRFKLQKKTDYKNIIASEIELNLDTVIGNKRILEVTFIPKRKINKLEFITKKELELHQFKVNDVLVNDGKKYSVKSGTFLVYHLGNQDDEVTLSFSVLKEYELNVILNEISYDLLENSIFSITPRTEEMMPMPFVNDAIIITKKLNL